MNIIELDSPDMSWTKKKIVDIRWQYANIRRHIKVEKNIIKGVKRWWHLRMLCRKANKTLLQMAKQMENKGLRPPPTMEELAQFKKEMGGEEILNTHHISRVTRSTKNLNMDIHYGN